MGWGTTRHLWSVPSPWELPNPVELRSHPYAPLWDQHTQPHSHIPGTPISFSGTSTHGASSSNCVTETQECNPQHLPSLPESNQGDRK